MDSKLGVVSLAKMPPPESVDDLLSVSSPSIGGMSPVNQGSIDEEEASFLSSIEPHHESPPFLIEVPFPAEERGMAREGGGAVRLVEGRGTPRSSQGGAVRDVEEVSIAGHRPRRSLAGLLGC